LNKRESLLKEAIKPKELLGYRPLNFKKVMIQLFQIEILYNMIHGIPDAKIFHV